MEKKQCRNQLVPSGLAKPLSEKEDKNPKIREDSFPTEQQEDDKLGRKDFTKSCGGGIG